MILKLCVVNDGDNVINKTLTSILEIDIILRKDFNIDKPVIFLTGSDYDTYLSFNYIHIPSLNRYYFIDSIEQVNNRVSKLNCTCDVLETFKSDILNSKAKIYRGIKPGDYMNGTLELSTKKTITTFDSDKGLEDGTQMILVTVEG